MATLSTERSNVKTLPEAPPAPSIARVPTNDTSPHSPARGNLARALASAQQSCRSVDRDATNDGHKYKYASAETIIVEAKRALSETGLALVPIELTLNGHEKESESRFELCRKFLLLHEGGESLPISMHWPIVPDRGRPLDKATAAADTTSLAYLLRDMLQMPRVDPADDITGRDDRDAQLPEPGVNGSAASKARRRAA